MIKEDAPTNNISSGNIKVPEAPLSKVKRHKFAGKEVFVVDNERFYKARHGKKKYTTYESYVGNDEIGEAIRTYAKSDYNTPIILQNENTGAMMYLRYGKGAR